MYILVYIYIIILWIYRLAGPLGQITLMWSMFWVVNVWSTSLTVFHKVCYILVVIVKKNHFITFLVVFDHWNYQLQQHQRLFQYNLRFLRYLSENFHDHEEVPRARRSIKIYLIHARTNYSYPVKWRLKITSNIGVVWQLT